MIIILMGVTGVGKTTIGKRLAASCNMRFYDADDYHPQANVEKMRAGIALNDEDRMPWLDRLNEVLREAERERASAVLACSALKRAYRERLTAGVADVRFVLLHGDKDLIRARLAARKGHYMNPALLDSQLETLEPPVDALKMDVADPPEQVAERIRKSLAL
jgi:gluconokinase